MGSQSDRIAREMNSAVETVMKKLTLDITANLKAAPSEGGTPVDTGNARAQWTPNIGKPYRSQGMPIGEDDVGAFVSSANSRAAVGEAKVATGYKLSSGSIFISNNAPYIEKINSGGVRLREASPFFVQRAIATAARMKYNLNAGTVSVNK